MPAEDLSRVVLTSKHFQRALERAALAMILKLTLASLCALFLLDAALFRTGFYVRYLEPSSSTGSVEAVLTIGRQKKFNNPHHVLVLGDSQIGEGFSQQVADREGASSGWEFLNAAVGGASIRSWYYMVRDLDPDRSRFDVIILPLRGYADVDDGEIRADRQVDVHWTIASIRLSDVPEFCASFPKTLTRMNVLRETLFKGLVYRRDLSEFLRDPVARMRHVNDCRAACAESFYVYPGRTEDLSGLWMDWSTNTIHFPPGVSAQTQADMKAHCNFQEWSIRGWEREFRKKWLGRIIDRYRGTRTKIAIIFLPYRPFPIPLSWPVDSQSFIVQAARNPQVTILDEHLFDDLQRPDYFFDVFHMNRKGRELFSQRLATTLIQRFGATIPAP
jgi:hypothetical protein